MEPFAFITEPIVLQETPEFYFVYKPTDMDSVPLRSDSAEGADSMEGPDRTEAVDLVSWFDTQVGSNVQAPASRSLGAVSSEIQPLVDRYRREHGLLSRLDRATSGLVLFARTFDVFVAFLDAQRQLKITKLYRACVSPGTVPLHGSIPLQLSSEFHFLRMASLAAEGNTSAAEANTSAAEANTSAADADRFPPARDDGFVVSSKFRSYGRGGARVACVDAAFSSQCKKPLSKEVYSTRLVPRGLATLDDASVARRAPEHKTSSRDNLPVLVLDAEIHTGFRHQIRAHLAWGGFPVLGDSLYGGLAARRLFLESYAIEVEHFGSSSLYFSLYE